MRSVLNGLCLLLVLVTVLACSQTLKKPEWTFDKAALNVHLKADNNLNAYNNKAHTLYVCFYQLETLNTFDQLTADSEGIRKLLDCRLYDDSVAAANNKVIHAGEDIVLTLDRAERAQYLALVAGYSSTLSDERAVRRLNYQVHKTKKGFFKPEYRCRPCQLRAEISLGANQIEYGKIIPNEEVMCNDECE